MFKLNLSAKTALLSGASVVAITLGAPAYATTLSGVTGQSLPVLTGAARPQGAPITGGINPLPSQVTQSAKDFTNALAAIKAQANIQAAARAAALAAPSTIPDGLGAGGLNPVANPKPAADDPTGLITWDGASAPTQTVADGKTNVTIQQTQERAILSWETFNVGKNTTVTFDQKGNKDWVALNRINDPAAAPSQIQGQIKADGTVLLINKNGVLFSGSAQVNTHSLIATALDVGPGQIAVKSGNNVTSWVTDTAWRNNNFLQNGLLGYDTSNLPYNVDRFLGSAQFSSLGGTHVTGKITIAAGASLETDGEGGSVMLVAPQITNAGKITTPAGQVIMAATSNFLLLTQSTGSSGDAVPANGAAPDSDIRGLVPYVPIMVAGITQAGLDYYVWNQSPGLIEADRGNITLIAPSKFSNRLQGLGYSGAVYNDGVLASTTSVSRNGSIVLDAVDIRLGSGSLISILPDSGGETIPQTPSSLAAFKSSAVKIGAGASTIEMQDSLLFAPGANVRFGLITPYVDTDGTFSQTILVNSGAVIDVGGLTDVLLPLSVNQIVIDPAKKNELRDSPLYRDGFLNGATIYLDPRISGVRDDGVAWIGSPLIDATAYYQLVGAGAAQLMTKGGNVSFGPQSSGLQSFTNWGTGGSYYNSPAVVIRNGATINISGGWVTYQAGTIKQTMLMTADGRIVPISAANPNDVFVGIYDGSTVDHTRWAISDSYAASILDGSHYEDSYIEGRDAGTLHLAGYALEFDGTLLGQAYAGRNQIAGAKTGTATSSISGDLRAIQKTVNELPAGGALIVATLPDIVVTHAVPGISDTAYDFTRGSIDPATGKYTAPVAPPTAAAAPKAFYLSDTLLSGAGLSEVSLAGLGGGSGTVTADATVSLAAGGVFRLVTGKQISIDGSVIVPSGQIILQTTGTTGGGFVDFKTAQLGDFDITVNGTLSVAGLWVNNYGNVADQGDGKAWLNGGTISVSVASNILQFYDAAGKAVGGSQLGPMAGGSAASAKDLSGSIIIGKTAKLNLSSGGYVDRSGKIDMSAKGGNLSLVSNTAYYQANNAGPSGFRVLSTYIEPNNGWLTSATPVNPDKINAKIVFDPASIVAHGFAGGGTFTLVTPEFSIGTGTSTTGTVVPTDFFSSAGFANYDITSNKTALSTGAFAGYVGYDALLAVQTVTVGDGQTLNLSQSVLPNILSADQRVALLGLASGGDVYSVVTAGVPVAAYDQKAVNLKLGGTLELYVAKGGAVTGAAGSSLSVSGLLNEGTIRIAGGTISQERTLQSLYVSGITGQNEPLGIRALSDIFSIKTDGKIDPNAYAVYGKWITNQQLVSQRGIYLLGKLDAGQGIVLASGSVTDLSGTALINPRAYGGSGLITTGTIVGGGSIISRPVQQLGTAVASPYQVGGTIIAAPGAVVDISGASAVFDQMNASGAFVKTPVWSDAGTIMAGSGGTFTGAVFKAQGGSDKANGGTFQTLNPILVQQDPATPAANLISADMISAAGFDTFVAIGNLTSQGDVKLSLDRAFFLQGKPWLGGQTALAAPVISTGGVLEIDAPYIALTNAIDKALPVTTGTAGTGSVTFKGGQIDITGSLLADKSVTKLNLIADGDIRLIGVAPWVSPADTSTIAAATLNGMIAVTGDLFISAGQVYPTTGSTFTITSNKADGIISFARSGSSTPATPYSAGGNLLVQAAHIVQGGVIRVPFGSLTLGGNSAFTQKVGNTTATYAPATLDVSLTDGSITSVSANGLVIPYGTTTDTKEWYFSPTSTDVLAGPPVKVLSLNGGDITLGQGATVDLSGGGDVYAYEFVSGTGGSHDVLDRYNSDQYSSNSGYQYADGRQVYAIVPGLANVPAAAYDPIYSADYSALYSASSVGKRVWLDAAPGLSAGWYTLLPAKYAMLPGGMRVVEQTGVQNVIPGTATTRPDGSILFSGYYGDAISGTSQSQTRLFSVLSQDVIKSYSNIALTSGNGYVTKNAADNGTVAVRNGLDAGRLILNPLNSMTIQAMMDTAAATGGRGAQVDITGTKIEILASTDGASDDGALHLLAGDLNKLNAESLLIGGVRTDNADGTTSLAVTANTILVANDATHPLSAPEIVLVVDDGVSGKVGSSLTLKDGATITATGTMNDSRTGAYIIDGQPVVTVSNGTPSYGMPKQSALGALVRVANGPERLVQRLRTPASSTNPGSPAGLPATLNVGAVSLKGDAVGLDTSNNVTIDPKAALSAKTVSLGATAIAFTNGTAAADTIIITPALQAVLSQGQNLTLHAQTDIGFDAGSYKFGDLTLDAASVSSRDGGAAVLNTGKLGLSNAGATGTASGGTGTLTANASEITLGSGTIATNGFGTVSLTAPGGIYASGQNGGLNTGTADLTLTTPYLGERAGATAAISAAITTTGKLTIAKGTGTVDASKVAPLQGASLLLQAGDIAIDGTRVHATAGTLNVKASGSIALSGGAILETPGYEKSFGDETDPQTVSALAGSLTLTAANKIALGDATLSVGGGSGNGGNLKLAAANGVIDWGTAVLDGKGGKTGTGGSFTLDTAGSIDLVALNTSLVANGFTAGFDIRTQTGDIVLGAGQTIKSGSVSLTADGGMVDIAGTIDTSGVNGGDITLYGKKGVTLEGTAKLDSHAEGYAADDTRKAQAGDITLGTDFVNSTINADGSITGTSGLIAIASGATVDASAKRPGDRLVRLIRNGVVNYQFVESDEGGNVSFRAPVINGTMNVTVASADSIKGAKAVNLEGFKRWDLKTVAGSGLYSGVTYNAATNTVTLDARTGLDTANSDGSLTTVNGLNFLGDKGDGSVVQFVQGYDVSASYGQLGGLASKSNFHARPGVELDHGGNITLASNWNLGAGTVNVDAAKAKGYMAVDGTTGQTYVVVGKEAAMLGDASVTKMTYRTGASARGEAPVVSLRAGGDLALQGSVTDGFFQFREQYDPTYQGYVHAKSANVTLSLIQSMAAQGSSGAGLITWTTYANATGAPYWNYYGQLFDSYSYNWQYLNNLQPGAGGAATAAPHIPFSAVANSAAALGNGPGGVGDPLASMEVFPLLTDGKVVASSDYRLVAGSALSSSDPLRFNVASTANLTVDGPKATTMTVANATIPGSFFVQVYDKNRSKVGSAFQAGQDGFDSFLQSQFPGLSADAAITLIYSNGGAVPSNLKQFIDDTLAADPTAHVLYGRDPSGYGYYQEVAISLSLFSKFLEQYSSLGSSGGGSAGNTKLSLYPKTMVRSGTGSIALEAAGNVDLTGGAVKYLNSGTYTSTLSETQVGGASVYTAGHPVAAFTEVLPDPKTGTAVTVTYTGPKTSVFAAPPSFNYGVPAPGQYGSDIAGVVIADTLNLTGGGDVTITAGGDVLGRRDTTIPIRASSSSGGGNASYPWIGSTYNSYLDSNNGQRAFSKLADSQLWRVSTVDFDSTTASINPQLFQDGLGTLGGGDITVKAGGSITDIAAVADTSLITATATPAGLNPTKVLITVGGGNVLFNAGADILAARIDAASGSATLSAGGRIGALNVPVYMTYSGYWDLNNKYVSFQTPVTFASETVVRIDDATVNLSAAQDITIQGIRMLDGFYSDASALNLVANGAITITNNAAQSPSLLNSSGAGRLGSYAIYPGTLTVASLAGDVNLRTYAAPIRYSGYDNTGRPITPPDSYNLKAPTAMLLVPSPKGQLSILAGGNILPTKIAMLDSDPYTLPGLFTAGGRVLQNADSLYWTGGAINYQFNFPAVFSNTTEGTIERQHNQAITHADDTVPAYVFAGGDIGSSASGVTLWLPKQARVSAGRDIVNMMFFGQNLKPTDVTRIVAGRDITATSTLLPNAYYACCNWWGGVMVSSGTPKPVLFGNSFVLGGPGDMVLEAGRDMGPFLNSAQIKDWNQRLDGSYPWSTDNLTGLPNRPTLTFGGGVITVGNDWNPFLPEEGANITVLFGVGKGADYAGLQSAYLDPANLSSMPDYLFEQKKREVVSGGITTIVTEADRTKPIYGEKLVAWLKAYNPQSLQAAYGTTDVTYEQAYAVFAQMPAVQQHLFLINDIYFNELRAPAVVDGPSYMKYSRGYTAVNTLFPAELGYTKNGLEGGAASDAMVHTGDLDLRLAAIETVNGGDINILGPGGRVLAGSVVSTAQQAGTRYFSGYQLYQPQQAAADSLAFSLGSVAAIQAIPPGYEGVITQRGGSINTFTDGDFLLNQSRLFTVKGGDITMWSSNADLNAGQGAKTTPNFPPVVVRIGMNGYVEIDQVSATSGAGIAALPPGVDITPPDVYLLAPRGTVDAGDAGVRVAGNLSVVAQSIANADNFQVQGKSFGLPVEPVTNLNLTIASQAATDAAAVTQSLTTREKQTTVDVEVTGFGDEDPCASPKAPRERCAVKRN